MVKSRVAAISPDYARELLSRNTTNRALRKAHVNHFADAMARGEWQLNGESIKAFNSFVDGNKISHLRFNASEKFPVIRGV